MRKRNFRKQTLKKEKEEKKKQRKKSHVQASNLGAQHTSLLYTISRLPHSGPNSAVKNPKPRNDHHGEKYFLELCSFPQCNCCHLALSLGTLTVHKDPRPLSHRVASFGQHLLLWFALLSAVPTYSFELCFFQVWNYFQQCRSIL